MVSDETRLVIDRAKEIYARLQPELESQHMNRFVAIEPGSGEYFLGYTFDEAVNPPRRSIPLESHTPSALAIVRRSTSGCCDDEGILPFLWPPKSCSQPSVPAARPEIRLT